MFLLASKHYCSTSHFLLSVGPPITQSSLINSRDQPGTSAVPNLAPVGARLPPPLPQNLLYTVSERKYTFDLLMKLLGHRKARSFLRTLKKKQKQLISILRTMQNYTCVYRAIYCVVMLCNCILILCDDGREGQGLLYWRSLLYCSVATFFC